MSIGNFFSNIKQYLGQPQEESFDLKDNLQTGLFISLAVGLIVYFFSLQYIDFDQWSKIKYSFYFALITFVIAFFNDFFWPKIFPQTFAEAKWTIGKSILWICWNFISIATANMVFMVYKG